MPSWDSGNEKQQSCYLWPFFNKLHSNFTNTHIHTHILIHFISKFSYTNSGIFLQHFPSNCASSFVMLRMLGMLRMFRIIFRIIMNPSWSIIPAKLLHSKSSNSVFGIKAKNLVFDMIINFKI